MPKVETWLKKEVIEAVEHMAEENQISRSNWIRDAVLDKLEVTDIKLVKELNVEIQDDDMDEDECFTTFLLLECMSCHWRFIGDVERYGYGYDSEGQDTPDYCPMCGKRIGNLVKEARHE